MLALQHLEKGLSLDKHVTISLWFTWTWLPLFTYWSALKDRITLPVEIYELPVWYTITATAHHIISPEGLLPPMSSHLYLWQLECDLVWPHFDKSHLELINMGDTLPPWLGVLRKDRFALWFNFHCSRERKALERSRRKEGRGKERDTRKALGEWWEMFQVAAPVEGSRLLHLLVPSSSLGWLRYLKGTSSKGGLGESHRSKGVTYFMGHFLPPLKALLNHNQITVDCRFLLDRKALE